MDTFFLFKRVQLWAQPRRKLAYEIRNLPIPDGLPWMVWCLVRGWSAETIVQELGRRSPPLVFVQVGSNDGITGDPLHTTVLRRGWKGLLIEPVPDVFKRLQANYMGTPDVALENAAIGDEGQKMATIYTVVPGADDPVKVDLLSSLSRHALSRNVRTIPDLSERIREIRVPSFTLPELAAKHGITRIDLLHIDAEGSDAEILDQIDFSSTLAPWFLVFERNHMTIPTYLRRRRRLVRAGYRILGIWPDAFAWRGPPPRSVT